MNRPRQTPRHRREYPGFWWYFRAELRANLHPWRTA